MHQARRSVRPTAASADVRRRRPGGIKVLGPHENVDAGECTFRTSPQIEPATPRPESLNRGVFISVGGRQAGGVIYETYLVD